MEISKAILALISIAINLRARAARLEELQAEQAATIAGLQAQVAALAPQSVDVSPEVAAALTQAAGS